MVAWQGGRKSEMPTTNLRELLADLAVDLVTEFGAQNAVANDEVKLLEVRRRLVLKRHDGVLVDTSLGRLLGCGLLLLVFIPAMGEAWSNCGQER